MKIEHSEEYTRMKSTRENAELGTNLKCYLQNGVYQNSNLSFSNECHLRDHVTNDGDTKKTSEGLCGDVRERQVGTSCPLHVSNDDKGIPTIVKKNIYINHKEEEVKYVYTLVSFKNYNIFFITHNGKFASWVHTYNVMLPFSVEQEAEIIFGERNYPFLEMFCLNFMKDHASLLKYKPVMFAISLYKMCFDDTDILTQIFAHVSDIVKSHA
ncbi:conserved Plasmodium protein, unknown function [Plasmodium ovale wallikeri]|uniref:Uncharacterized protein n=2 Tax=Plasmodium ovale TaxID=36330 RepID=A0A1A8ZK78_PLAOA|nr:conserved Plasmodium protein, unknown function [Plasmodium ovale wallikeri]SBT45011.1 conserved Plasmodium protein, unknown function [Plasmodium ovale wallikeri]SBT78684.1 conserved Plasmodium protein, unknown function [Plasmodium ovale]